MCIAPCHNLSLQTVWVPHKLTSRLQMMFVFRSIHGGDRTSPAHLIYVGMSGIITNVIIINIIAILIIVSNYYSFIYFLFSLIIISSIINPVNTVWELYPRWNPRDLSCLTSLTLCTVCVSAACGVWLHRFHRVSDSECAAEVRHSPR